MDQNLRRQLKTFIKEHHLPEFFNTVISTHYLPLAHWISTQRRAGETWVIGLSGAQGTGKSTLSSLLKVILEQFYSCNTAIISLDDLYLSKIERRALAKTVHPLLQTRGVPGTHDPKLGLQLLRDLSVLGEKETVLLPRFDKASDERLPKEQWEVFAGPADIVIFEGWCVGVSASSEESLVNPINELEAQEDKDGRWRRFVNQQLQADYKKLFARSNAMIMLQAPNFACIHRWRWMQEQQLAVRIDREEGMKAGANKIMDEAGVRRFIQHYERLTRQCLEQLPGQADVVLQLSEDHGITRSHYQTS